MNQNYSFPKLPLYTLFLFTLLIPLVLKAQETLPLSKNEGLQEQFLQQFEVRHKANISLLSGENKKYLLQEYQKRFDHIKALYETNQFVSDLEVSGYLNNLVQRILKANTSLRSLQPSVHFSRVYWPNASSYGEGTITFNISLFNRLQNESQAVFVLCHELAHYYLDHSNKSIHEYVSMVNSAAFQQELKTLNKTTYQKNQKADELIKNITYTSKRHSRKHEIAADSMALELMKPTGYDIREALSCLALLNNVDEDKHANVLDLESIFNFQEFPFRQRWIKPASLSLSEAMKQQETGEVANVDSLKTHPDCIKRIAALENEVKLSYAPSQKLFLENRELFMQLIHRFDVEIIAYCQESGETGRALFYSLQLFSKSPQNAYLAATIGHCLNEIYKAQKTHTLSKLVDLAGDEGNLEYKEFIRFIRNLRLEEIAALNYYFMQKHYEAYKADKYFNEVLAESQSIYKTVNQ